MNIANVMLIVLQQDLQVRSTIHSRIQFYTLIITI